jgi:putative transposase
VGLCRRRKRRKEMAELLHALIDKQPAETGSVAADRLVWLYLPTYSPWLNPIAMLGRHFRRAVTHWERFESRKAAVAAGQDFFARYHQYPECVLSIIGAIPKNLPVCTECLNRAKLPGRGASA